MDTIRVIHVEKLFQLSLLLDVKSKFLRSHEVLFKIAIVIVPFINLISNFVILSSSYTAMLFVFNAVNPI